MGQRAGASSHIASASGVTVLVAQTLAARSRESCAAFGQTSRQILVATMVGSRIPARSVVVSSMRPTPLGGHRVWFAAVKLFVCNRDSMQQQQIVKSKSYWNIARRQPHEPC